jgi:alpha-ketoglutarate-dependent taurine dioxygenase
MAKIDPKLIQRELEFIGWCWIPPASATAPASILAYLGPLVPARKSGADHRDLEPYTRKRAPPASMSATTGTDAQPRHTDAAYFPRPPRYIALQCLEPGEVECPTHVWPLDLARLKKDRPKVLTEPRWVARGGGHTPFYCSVMEVQHAEVRVRFDPLCMHLMSGCSWTVDTAQSALASYSRRIDFIWERGALLIINNWACLHARGRGAGSAPSRRLRRWSIGVVDGLVT